MKYTEAHDVKKLVDEIIDCLGLFHIVPQSVYCYRSEGSRSKRVVARIHGLGRIWQKALIRSTAYVIEVISERYDNLSDRGKEKILIHELLHIPKGFSGGFLPHKGNISKRRIERLHEQFLERRNIKSKGR